MIEEEELIGALDEIMDSDMSDGARQYLAEALLEKYILVERPKLEEISEENGRVKYNGLVLLGDGVGSFRRRAADAGSELMYYAKEHAVYTAIVDYLEESESVNKHERREELSKESGYPVYMYAPQAVKTLIARLVDEEFKNAVN